MSVSYPDVLLLMRLENFVRTQWPQRRFRYDRHWPGSLDVTRHVYFRWATFADETPPFAVGIGLNDPECPEPLFEVVEWHAPDDVRRSLWHYRSTGWHLVAGADQARFAASLPRFKLAFK